MGAERERVAGFGRLEDGLRQASPWYLWGPYISERQWGTVREDYSADGNAWAYLPHDQARSRAYRWGQDGLAGFCDIDVALYLDGSDDPDRAADGSPETDDDFLVLVSAWWEPLVFTIPVTRPGQAWRIAVDTYAPARPATAGPLRAGDQLTVNPRSIVVLQA